MVDKESSDLTNLTNPGKMINLFHNLMDVVYVNWFTREDFLTSLYIYAIKNIN